MHINSMHIALKRLAVNLYIKKYKYMKMNKHYTIDGDTKEKQQQRQINTTNNRVYQSI